METIRKEEFITIISDESSNFFINELLVRKTITHFKELRKIVSAAVAITCEDNIKKDFVLLKSNLRGTKKDLRQKDKKEVVEAVAKQSILFNSCSHNYPVGHVPVNETRIFCSKCEAGDESQAGKYSLNQKVLNEQERIKERIREPIYAGELEAQVYHYDFDFLD